ncbi:DNA mismatch repair endonuclease MutL [Thermus thermamylovorans]|uniref:DNA mismatch repair protein MutL n=1 Tax=Thermus thermamylovorans TaxID=2509362 RepID=A0A4Q9B4W0_9DEIN|nr:DNA mismatch repair endonuclease MutL [Thermus thermamylovorans]TBH20624.1 DNA mismatch repair protein MutL [Thermus thermamylovorans]
MIRPLPEELRGLLARGEVLLGVKDAVRELLENALDAGARRVRVELWGGGLERLAVEDDGAGIPLEELPLAVEPFATSKLTDPAHITTLGFRGQALYALRQAALLRLRSRPRGQVGGGLLLVQGDRVELKEVPAPPGTWVEAVGLFRGEGRDPAREARGVLDLLRRYLLHHPFLSLALFAEGEARLLFPGAGLREAARLAFGPVLSARLLPLEAEAGGMRLQGLLSGPQASRTRPDLLFLAVNGRPVAWPEGLLKALRRAYRELLPEGHFPVGAVNLSLPPGLFRLRLDARKEEVEVAREVEALLGEAVGGLFARLGLARALPEPKPLLPLSPPTPSGLPRLRYLAQFRESYLLAQGEDTLYVVDQHAAHERVIFEEFQRRLEAEGPKPLPYPVLVELSPEEEALLGGEALAALFAHEAFGPGRVRLLAAPAFLHPYPLLLPEVFREALRGEGRNLRGLLARLACLPAVKAGHPLGGAQGQALLDALLACRTPWVCPHGRPVLLALKEEDLIRRFGRRSGARAGGEARPRPPGENSPEAPWPKEG